MTTGPWYDSDYRYSSDDAEPAPVDREPEPSEPDRATIEAELAAVVIVCACGTSITLAQWWADCPAVGFMPDGAGGILELRNCPACGSTRALETRSHRSGDHHGN